MARGRSGAICGLILVLAGCATQPRSALEPATVFDATIPEYAAWTFRGRVSLVRGEQGWHAGMNWHETAGHYRLNLAGPLGQGQHFAMAGAYLHPDKLFPFTLGDGGMGEPYVLSAMMHFHTASYRRPYCQLEYLLF